METIKPRGWNLGRLRLVGGTGHGGMIYTIIVAVIGAVILTWIVRLITGSRGSGSGTNLRQVA